MAMMSFDEKARVWNSLDDNLREKIRTGELTIEEASKFVVPIGDRELSRMRSEQPRPIGLDTAPEATEEYGLGTMLDTSLLNLESAGQAAGALVDVQNADLTQKVIDYRGRSFGDVFGSEFEQEMASTPDAAALPGTLGAGAKLGQRLGAASSALATTLTAKLQAAKLSDEELENERAGSIASLATNVEQLEDIRNRLAELPANPYSQAFVGYFDDGDYLRAATAAPMAVATTLGEQAPTLLAQIGVTAGTYAATRNKTATAIAAKAAGGLGGLTEFGSDYLSIINAMPEEDRQDLEKVKQALRTAKDAALVRTGIEAALPGIGGQIGSTAVRRAGAELVAQMGSGAVGEYAAAQVMGQDRSAGELALEALADSAGVVTEAGPSLRNASIADAQLRADAAATQKAIDDELNSRLKGIEDQRRAEANRAVFDAEVEADKAIEALKMQSPTQTEMPFGSDMAGDPTQNDRTPAVQDMFSGELVNATKVQQRLEQQVPVDQMPEETDEAFEIRKQRETDARNQIDQRKQADFENQKQRQEVRRRQLAEDETLLKQERQILSNAGIKQEADRRLAIELEGVRSRPFNKTPQGQRALPKVLENYERKRKPELLQEVREQQQAKVTAARERIANQKALEDIDVDNELAARQQVRDAAARKAEQGPAEDLFADLPGQRELPVNEPQSTDKELFTGSLTEDQKKTELAAGQLQRQRMNEKVLPEQRKQQAALLEAEIATVSKAINTAQNAKTSLTLKNYADKEKKALSTFVKEELGRPAGTYANISDVETAVAKRLTEWRKANPAPKDAPAPKTESSLEERAASIQKAKETAAKTKETKAVNKQLKREIDKGATPKEAAETVTNRRLSEKEDAAVRKELGAKEDIVPSVFLGEVHESDNIRNNNLKTQRSMPRYHAAVKQELESDTPSITKLIDIILATPDVPAFQKQLARRLKPLLGALEVKLAPAPEGMNLAGGYGARLNTIFLNVTQPETIIHEALHAVLYNALEHPTKLTPEMGRKAYVLRSNLENIRLKLIDTLNNPTITRTGQVTNRNLGNRLSEGQGPLSDIHELISWFMTNPDLQFLANQVPGVPGIKARISAVAKEIYGQILEFLGLRDQVNIDTAMKQLSDTTNELIDIVGMDLDALKNLVAIKSGRVLAQEEPTFSDPVTKRSLKELSAGNIAAKFKPEWLSSPIGTLIDALTSGAGKSSVTTEIFDRSQSSTSSLILRAEQLYRAIDFSLERGAIEAKVPMNQYRDQFIADVTQFEKTEGRTSKAIQARNMRSKYGLAARSYFQMRRTIDNLSRDILRQRLEDPRPFTEQEAKIYRSIKENIGSYYTRVYASNTKGIGGERAKKLWKEYTKRASGDKNPELEEGYRVIRNAAMYVREHLLSIPDRDTMEEMPLVKLQKLADAWGILPLTGADLENTMQGDVRRQALIDGLEKFADATPDAKDKKAIALVEDMLFNKADSTLMNYYRGAKQDRTIVTEREHVPEDIRKLLGEFEDIPLRGMLTITRQAEFRARNKAFNELIAEESGTRILTDEEFTERGLSPQDWTKLQGAGYGALEDLWVRKDLAKKIEDSAEVTRTFDEVMAMADNRPLELPIFFAKKGLAAWAKAASHIKALQLVWNMGNMVFNFGGGLIITLSNGNFSPASVGRAFNTAWNLIKASRQSGNLTGDMEKVVRAGITDSAFMGEIRAVELDQLRQMTMDALRSPGERKVREGVERSKAVSRAWREAYAMADVVWKIANFYAEEAKLEKFYKAEGIPKTAEQIEREAAWKTNVSNFSYKRVPGTIKIAEKAGLTYIMPYIYETFRAPVGSLLIGFQDMSKAKNATTTEGKNTMYWSGAKRIIGSTMALGAAQQMAFMLAQQIAQAMGESDDEQEEWVEKLKALLPEYKQNADYLYAGRKDGKPVLFEFSRLDPMGPATEFYKLAMKGASPQEFLDAGKRLLIENPYGTTILQAMLGTGPTNSKLETIDPEAYENLVEMVGPHGARAADVVIPSWPGRALDPNNEAPDDQLLLRLLTNMGMSVQQVDPGKSVEFVANDYKAERDEIREDFKTFLKTQHNLDDNELLARFADLQERESENFEKLSNLYEGMLQLEYTPAQVLGMLKSEKLTDADLAMLYAGGYRPEGSGIISMQGIERSWEDAVEKQAWSDAKREKYFNNLMRVVRLVEEGRLPARE